LRKDFAVHGVSRLFHRQSSPPERLACLRQCQPFFVTIEQACSKDRFEGSDASTDSGLRGPQILGGRIQTACSPGGEEEADVVPIAQEVALRFRGRAVHF
jgi:hypothetical protein